MSSNPESRLSKVQTLIVMLMAITDSAFEFFVQDPLKTTLDTLHSFIEDIVRDTDSEYVYPDRSTPAKQLMMLLNS